MAGIGSRGGDCGRGEELQAGGGAREGGRGSSNVAGGGFVDATTNTSRTGRSVD